MICECHGCSLLVAWANGSYPLCVAESAIKRDGRPLDGASAGRRGTFRGGSTLGYESGSRAPVGGAREGACLHVNFRMER